MTCDPSTQGLGVPVPGAVPAAGYRAGDGTARDRPSVASGNLPVDPTPVHFFDRFTAPTAPVSWGRCRCL